MKPVPTFVWRSQARSWHDLADTIEEGLFETQHCSQGLQGVNPKLLVLLSRDLLPPENPENMAALVRLSAQLRQQQVLHGIHCVAAGNPEPAFHLVQITLI